MVGSLQEAESSDDGGVVMPKKLDFKDQRKRSPRSQGLGNGYIEGAAGWWALK